MGATLVGVGLFLVGVSAGGFSVMLLTNPSVKWANDRIDGLESDLRSAVLCAYMRGAKEWAVLNYPD